MDTTIDQYEAAKIILLRQSGTSVYFLTRIFHKPDAVIRAILRNKQHVYGHRRAYSL